jgi:hypothetical protein
MKKKVRQDLLDFLDSMNTSSHARSLRVARGTSASAASVFLGLRRDREKTEKTCWLKTGTGTRSSKTKPAHFCCFFFLCTVLRTQAPLSGTLLSQKGISEGIHANIPHEAHNPI